MRWLGVAAAAVFAGAVLVGGDAIRTAHGADSPKRWDGWVQVPYSSYGATSPSADGGPKHEPKSDPQSKAAAPAPAAGPAPVAERPRLASIDPPSLSDVPLQLDRALPEAEPAARPQPPRWSLTGSGAGAAKGTVPGKDGDRIQMAADGPAPLMRPAGRTGGNGRYSGTFVVSEDADVQQVSITVNKSRTFRVGQPFDTATVGSSEIADVLPMSNRILYIQARKIGTTNVSFFDVEKRLIGILDLEVVPDTANLQQKIRASTGSGGIQVSSAQGQIVLTGTAPDAVAAERAVAVARSLAQEGGEIVNAMQVAPSQQVMLEVRFLEVSRSAGRELGVNLFGANRSGTRGVNTGLPGGTQNPALVNPREQDRNRQIFNQPNIGELPLISGLGTLVSGTNPYITILTRLFSHNGRTADALITALEDKGVLRRLAEPNLIALSGDEARFLAGGEIPVPVPREQNVGIEWKKFGVELAFTPTVLSRGVISLRIFPSVSELDYANAIQLQGFLVPALVKRDAETRVELRDGQSFAIAGLLQSMNRRNISQVPGIGSVPVLGALFRSADYQQNETDLVIIVTPRLVKPAVPGQRIATPFDSRLPSNDIDFFLGGQLEVKRRHDQYMTAEKGLKGPYGHIIQPLQARQVGPAPRR